MKKSSKVTRILANTFLLAFMFLMSCSKDDGPDPVPEKETLILTPSSTVVSDGAIVQFAVAVNNVVVDDAIIYVDGVAIANDQHTFFEPGTYSVVAKKEGFADSKAVTITVNKDLVDVYVAGSEYVDGVEQATYWKNGVAHHLTSGTTSARAYKVIVRGADVYVLVEVGYRAIKYWKNDEEHLIYSQDNADVYARDMFVSDNGDVYIAGASTEKNGNLGAKYWKNGVMTKLVHNTISTATGIAVNGNDVYVSGYSLLNNTDDMPIAVYWKNGVAFPLSDGTVRTMTSKIAVSGNDVHITGSVADGTAKQWLAKYWKNGEETNLLNGQEANDIFIDGTDVYITGRQGGVKYWKNGVPFEIPGGSFIYGITVLDDTVYTVGTTWNSETNVTKAVYWKNTTMYELSEGTQYPNANSIAVVAH